MTTAKRTEEKQLTIQQLQYTTALLNLDSVSPIVGSGPKQQLAELFQWLIQTRSPLYLVGDSGTGKSATMKALLKIYAKSYGCPAYYVQLSPEDTKTTVLLGHRMVHGNMEIVEGVLARAARENAIVGIDEITQSTQQMLTMLTAIDGQESLIAVGDRIIDASGMRVVYGSNRSAYAGNIRIPPAFANRVVTKLFDYPALEDEIAIAKAVTRKNYIRTTKYPEIVVPEEVIRYITSYIREMREEARRDPQNLIPYPLSVRNISNIILGCHLAAQGKTYVPGKFDPHFAGSNSNIESIRRAITRRVTGQEANDTQMLSKPEILKTVGFFSTIGVEVFRRIVLEGINWHADIDGVEMVESFREKMRVSII